MIACTVAFAFGACGGGDGSTPTAPQPGGPAVREVIVTPDSLRLAPGQTATLRAEARGAAGTVASSAIEWASETPTVASVSPAGVVTAVSPGRVRVSARAGSIMGTAWVSVVRPDTASAVVRATDTTRVIAGNGSGVFIPPGALPAGVRVSAEERQEGAGRLSVRITVTALASVARLRAQQSTSTVAPTRVLVMTAAPIPSTPLPRLRVTAVLPNNRRVVTAPVADAVSPAVDQAGRTVTRIETTLLLSNAAAQGGRTVVDLEYLPDPTPEAVGYALYAAGSRGVTTRFSGARIPVVFMHGLQPGRLTAADFSAWFPDDAGDLWESLLGGIAADAELRTAVEPWVFRYPTYNGMAFSARRFRELLTERFGTQPVMVVAHSTGGLVATVGMLDEASSPRIARLISLGTPYLGSPLARDDLSTDLVASEVAAGRCAGAALPVANRSGVLTELVADRSDGYRDLSDRSSIIERVRQGVRSLDGRIRAVAGAQQSGTGASAGNALALPGCAMRALDAGDNDGVVAAASATPPLVASSARVAADHLSLTTNATARADVLQTLRTFVRAQPRLVFATEPPARAIATAPLPAVRVAIRDGSGQTLTGAAHVVSLALAPNSQGAVLGGAGTRPAVQGVATFEGLTIDRPGTYTLVAQSPSLPSVGSTTITVDSARAITSLAVSPTSLSLGVGATGTITATITQPSGVAAAVVSYASLNSAVATVTGTGNSATVRSVALGSTTIRVTATATGTAAFPATTVTADVAVTVAFGGGGTGLGANFGTEQFALVPAGSFRMGTATGGFSDERPVRQVTISRAFLLQRTEVTQWQWRAVMGTNPSAFPTCGDTCPVENVSWLDIQTFLQRLNTADPGKNYRLPTEAEWEYAARAGTTGDYGNAGNICTFAWVFDSGCDADATRRVAQGLANAWGLFDMHGNVWEWVQDWYGPYPSAAQTDPTGPTTGSSRVLRGGSWFGDAIIARSAYRGESAPSARLSYDGFRLVRNP
ncbi:SUMF1/EgtB/PvdO family nonheme iron enzyme [Gemmatimonas sp.]|uniref:SUMF1/EgtB/PvdO family nonheme iron enzyme n=1 Tax=Gemmatimonas sp. TaxID=1962908 RepID=UPI0037BED806